VRVVEWLVDFAAMGAAYHHRPDAEGLQPELSDLVFAAVRAVAGVDLVDHSRQEAVREALIEAAAELRRIVEGVQPEAHAAGCENALPLQVPVEPLRGFVLDGAVDVDGAVHVPGEMPVVPRLEPAEEKEPEKR